MFSFGHCPNYLPPLLSGNLYICFGRHKGIYKVYFLIRARPSRPPIRAMPERKHFFYMRSSLRVAAIFVTASTYWAPYPVPLRIVIWTLSGPTDIAHHIFILTSLFHHPGFNMIQRTESPCLGDHNCTASFSEIPAIRFAISTPAHKHFWQKTISHKL